MTRPRILTITVTVTAALAVMLTRNVGQLTPAESVLAAALALFAAATTVHAIVRPARRPPLDEAYVRSYLRTSSRLTRSR